jgi:hypothetical protein
LINQDDFDVNGVIVFAAFDAGSRMFSSALLRRQLLSKSLQWAFLSPSTELLASFLRYGKSKIGFQEGGQC